MAFTQIIPADAPALIGNVRLEGIVRLRMNSKAKSSKNPISISIAADVLAEMNAKHGYFVQIVRDDAGTSSFLIRLCSPNDFGARKIGDKGGKKSKNNGAGGFTVPSKELFGIKIPDGECIDCLVEHASEGVICSIPSKFLFTRSKNATPRFFNMECPKCRSTDFKKYDLQSDRQIEGQEQFHCRECGCTWLVIP